MGDVHVPAVWNASMAGSRRVERFAGELPAPGLAMVFAEGHVEDVQPGLASPRYRCSISARSARPACHGARPVTTQTICLLSRMEALIGRRRRRVSITCVAPGKSTLVAGEARSTRRVRSGRVRARSRHGARRSRRLRSRIFWVCFGRWIHCWFHGCRGWDRTTTSGSWT